MTAEKSKVSTDNLFFMLENENNVIGNRKL